MASDQTHLGNSDFLRRCHHVWHCLLLWWRWFFDFYGTEIKRVRSCVCRHCWVLCWNQHKEHSFLGLDYRGWLLWARQRWFCRQHILHRLSIRLDCLYRGWRREQLILWMGLDSLRRMVPWRRCNKEKWNTLSVHSHVLHDDSPVYHGRLARLWFRRNSS